MRDKIDGEIEVEDAVLDGGGLTDHIDHRLSMCAYEDVLRVEEPFEILVGFVGEEEEAAQLSGVGLDLAILVDEQIAAEFEGVLEDSALKFRATVELRDESHPEL